MTGDAGYVRPVVTDAAVEAAARALDEWHGEDDSHRHDARIALEAALDVLVTARATQRRLLEVARNGAELPGYPTFEGADGDVDEMDACPNCLTGWLCMGPHLPGGEQR